MNQKRYVVGLGEVLWDVLPEGKKLGGAPANFAYHAGQFLGIDNTIAVSALGNDKLGDETIEALKEHGLNDLLPRVPYPTGTVQVQLDEQGIPTYDIKENVVFRASLPPSEPTIAPPPRTPKTKSALDFLMAFLALKAAGISFNAPLIADSFVALWPPA